MACVPQLRWIQSEHCSQGSHSLRLLYPTRGALLPAMGGAGSLSRVFSPAPSPVTASTTTPRSPASASSPSPSSPSPPYPSAGRVVFSTTVRKPASALPTKQRPQRAGARQRRLTITGFAPHAASATTAAAGETLSAPSPVDGLLTTKGSRRQGAHTPVPDTKAAAAAPVLAKAGTAMALRPQDHRPPPQCDFPHTISSSTTTSSSNSSSGTSSRDHSSQVFNPTHPHPPVCSVT